MNSVQIRCFLEAARSGSFTEAAEKLYMTQPTFGRQISSLEKELGFALLHRAKSGVQPTAECCQLLPLVRELLFAQERLEVQPADGAGRDPARRAGRADAAI